MKKFAIILSGCGVYDGSEIHEAVMTMLAIDRAGAKYDIFAPDINQHHVINHTTGQEMPETRNVLVESARIARGKIEPLKKMDIRNYDGIVLPGGFGVAKNLCNYAFEQENMTVLPEIEKIIKEAVSLKKPIGALCISPVLLAKILPKSSLTIGNDSQTIEHIGKMGAKHKSVDTQEVVVDEDYKIFTAPCYMLDSKISDIAESADKVIRKMMSAL